MLLLLSAGLLVGSLLVLVSKKNRESLLLSGMCLSLTLFLAGVMILIAKKGGISRELEVFLFFSHSLRLWIQYRFITLGQLGYLIAIGRHLFPLFLVEMAMCYSMLPAVRKHPMLRRLATVLPIVTLVIVSVGSLMRYTRTNMLEVLNSDYIRTARAKGLSERKVIYHHAFRNTLIPLVTIVGGSLPGLFSGALITETLFSINGIGFTSYQAMTTGDIPFSMFYLSFMAILTLLGNLISDILYAVVDPRVRIA